MATPDFNLLRTLDVLLTEQNVARAAQRLKLSPSAMSRALARLRETTGDPLLVRAGRGLVPTPRALDMHARIGPLVRDIEEVLHPLSTFDPLALARTFTLRSSEGFVENFGAALLARVAAEAPSVRLHFMQKADKSSSGLRDATVDLETGVTGASMGPEVRAQALFQDRWIAVVRRGHPLAHEHGITPQQFAQCRHIAVSRRGVAGVGPIDESLARLGLQRNVVAMTGGFAAALALAKGTDLVACVPERHTAALRDQLSSFALPFPAPGFTVSLFWHPRYQADPGHRWLRQLVQEVCGSHWQGPLAEL